MSQDVAHANARNVTRHDLNCHLASLADRKAGGVELIVASRLLKVYADESGIHRGSKRCVVAGYLGSPHKWQRFSQAWQKVLCPEWQVFHAKEFFGRKGRPLKLDEATVFLDRLLGVIEDHDMHPFASSVIIEDWLSLGHGVRAYLTGGELRSNGRVIGGAPNTPYFLGFWHALFKVSHMVQSTKTVEFIFDRQDEYRRRALHTFNLASAALARHQGNSFGLCTFANKAEHPPLQVADLLAHCIYNLPNEDNPLRKRAEMACAKGGFYRERYDAACIADFLDFTLSPTLRRTLEAIPEPTKKAGRRTGASFSDREE